MSAHLPAGPTGRSPVRSVHPRHHHLHSHTLHLIVLALLAIALAFLVWALAPPAASAVAAAFAG